MGPLKMPRWKKSPPQAMLVTAKYDMETGYDVCNNELLRKLTQDPAPLSVPVFAQRFCVPHPQGVKFPPISQNG